MIYAIINGRIYDASTLNGIGNYDCSAASFIGKITATNLLSHGMKGAELYALYL